MSESRETPPPICMHYGRVVQVFPVKGAGMIVWASWDLSNKDGRTYLWTAPTREAARVRRREHQRNPRHSNLGPPFRTTLWWVKKHFATGGIAKGAYWWRKKP